MLFREILAMLRRWLWLLILGAVIGGVLGYISVARRPLVYEAAAGVVPIRRDFVVKLEPRVETTTSDILSSDSRTNDGLATLASVVTNEAIAETVFSSVQDSAPARFKEPSDLVSSVSSEVRDGIIRVKVRSTDPRFASTLANAWARAYAVYVNRIYSGSSGTVELGPQVESAKERYETAEAAVVDFIRANDVDEKRLAIDEKQAMVDELLRLRRESLTGQLNRLADRRQKLADVLVSAQVLKDLQAQNESVATSAANTLGLLLLQLASVEGMATASTGGGVLGQGPQIQFNPTSLEELVTSPEQLVSDLDHLIAVLQQRQQETETEIAAISAQIGLAQQLEADPLLAGILTEIRALRSESAALTAQRQALERERDLLWDGYTLLANEAEELSIASGATDGSVVRFAVPASVPRRPIQTPPLQQAILGAVFGFVIAAVVAFLLEIMDDKVRSREDVEEVVHLPLLGLVPRSAPLQNGAPISLGSSTAALVESVRFLRDVLESHAQTSQVVLFTPVTPRSGASSLAANLAVVTAQAGRRVILVDADIRSPRLHQWFGLSNDAGLANLAETPTPALEALLQSTSVPGLRVLTTGSAHRLTPDLLASPQMAGLLDQLRQQADLVVIDAASASVASDAILLAEKADGVVLVLRSGKASVSDIQHVREAVEMVSGHVLGVVLNYAPSARNIRLSSGAAVGSEPNAAAAAA